MTQQKLILVDADGVLFDWEWGFDRFVQTRGFEMQPGGQDQYLIHRRYDCDEPTGRALIKDFNESPSIAFLPPLRDSVKWVQQLHSEGWQFHCITSLSRLTTAKEFRRRALDRVFGNGVIGELTCLSTGSDKDLALKPYRDSGCYWLEDKIENAIVGHEMGLKSILMAHGHNMTFEHQFIPRVKNWSEIYNLITNANH